MEVSAEAEEEVLIAVARLNGGNARTEITFLLSKDMEGNIKRPSSNRRTVMI